MCTFVFRQKDKQVIPSMAVVDLLQAMTRTMLLKLPKF